MPNSDCQTQRPLYLPQASFWYCLLRTHWLGNSSQSWCRLQGHSFSLIVQVGHGNKIIMNKATNKADISAVAMTGNEIIASTNPDTPLQFIIVPPCKRHTASHMASPWWTNIIIAEHCRIDIQGLGDIGRGMLRFAKGLKWFTGFGTHQMDFYMRKLQTLYLPGSYLFDEARVYLLPVATD